MTSGGDSWDDDGEATLPPRALPFQEAPETSASARYQIETELGSGAMGVVYLAYDRELDEHVALKTLHEGLVADARAVVRFRREVKLARRVTHPNVARIFDLGRSGPHVFLTMEYIDGRSLGARVAEAAGPMDWRDVIEIALQICAGLEAAHSVEVVHRDLKPDNIMFDKTGRALLTDFGIAVAMGEEARGVAGTPYYIAPEQARGLPVDARADLYALGCMLFQMLAGVLPWTGNGVSEIMLKRLLEPPPALPSELDIPEELRLLVQSCMARDHEARPPDAASVERSLRAILADPAASTLVIEHAPTTNMPARSKSFLGRDEELAELTRRLVNDRQRLVCLLGPGGVGKGDLAREFGRIVLRAFPGGVWYLDATACLAADDLLEKLAVAMGSQRPGPGAAEDLLRGAARRGRSLVVIDDVESCLDPLRDLLSAWLPLDDDLYFLVSSRVRLGLGAEHVVPVTGLSTDAAISLFVTRARQRHPDFVVDDAQLALVREIVTNVDCLPLAIEMVASQTHLVSLDTLLERLSDRFRTLRARRSDGSPRHGALAAVLNESWEALSDAAKIALTHLSVFRGGATLDAALSVIDVSACDQDRWPEEIVEELWDNSLVQWAGHGRSERLQLLKSVRDYAEIHLTDPGPARQRHATYFANLYRGKRPSELTVDEAQRLAYERENLVAACETMLSLGDANGAVSALEGLHRLTNLRGGNITRLARRVVEMAGRDPEAQTRADLVLGWIYQTSGDERASRWLDEAIARAAPTETGVIAELRAARAMVDWQRGDYTAANETIAPLWEEALAGDDRLLPILLGRVYMRVLQNLNDLERAEQVGRIVLTLAREEGVQAPELDALQALGLVATSGGRLDEAEEHLSRAYELAVLMGAEIQKIHALHNLSSVRVTRGDLDGARELLEEALACQEATGHRRAMAFTWANLCDLDSRLGYHHEAIARGKQCLEIARLDGYAELVAYVGVRLASMFRQRSELDSAEENLTEAESARRVVAGSSEDVWIFVERGFLRAARGDADGAIAALEEARSAAGRITSLDAQATSALRELEERLETT